MARKRRITIVIVVDPKSEKILLLETKPPKKFILEQPASEPSKKVRIRDPQEYPGGGAKEGETDLEAGVREVKEETGLDVLILPDPILELSPTMKVYVGLSKSTNVVLSMHTNFGWYLHPEDVPLPSGRELPPSYEGQWPPKSMYEEFRLAKAVLAAHKSSIMP